MRFAEAFVKFIVEQGVDENIENNYGDTALDIARLLNLKNYRYSKKAQKI
ncbi:ankyrin repeat domain-containing protein [Brachyspira sp.]|nr:ankyrin repeat domain-containing protein [Brachyspira sp.]